MAQPSEEQMERMSFVGRALEFQKEDERHSVVARASRVVDVLEGKWPDVELDAVVDEAGGAVTRRGYSSAPVEVPHLRWKSRVTDELPSITTVGNLGEFFARTFANERPGQAFNVGFYAAILAVKAGLIDSESFHRDTEMSVVEARFRQLDPEFAAFDDEVSPILDRLGEAGWSFGGGENVEKRTILLGFSLPDHLADRGEAVFAELPIRDDDGNLYSGFEFSLDQETGEPGMGYEGPLDDRFRQVVDAMVEIARPPEA